MPDAPAPGAIGLFDSVLARGPVREAVGDRAWLQAMLDFESALVRALARAGLIPADQAHAIGRACRPEDYDVAALGRAAAAIGNPAQPLGGVLTGRVPGSAAGQVHRGGTSEDVLDTAMMIVARDALDRLRVDLDGAGDSAAALADRHRATLMAGRTLLQQALPVTFGLEAAGRLAGLDAADAPRGPSPGRAPGVPPGGAG